MRSVAETSGLLPYRSVMDEWPQGPDQVHGGNSGNLNKAPRGNSTHLQRYILRESSRDPRRVDPTGITGRAGIGINQR